MKRQRRLNAFVAIFFLGILLFSLGELEVLAAPVSIATTTSTVAAIPTLAFTPTPVVENGVEPQAWPCSPYQVPNTIACCGRFRIFSPVATAPVTTVTSGRKCSRPMRSACSRKTPTRSGACSTLEPAHASATKYWLWAAADPRSNRFAHFEDASPVSKPCCGTVV